jgi:ATP-dependent RNA helicase DeaD
VLQKKFGVVFEEKQMPTQEEARRIWTERHVHELRDGMSASIFEGFIPLAQEIKARPDGDHLLAFALKYFFAHHRIEKVQDLQKAVHKKEEHDRKEQKVGGKREGRSESRAEPRERPGREPREGREGRDRGGRDRGERDRGERGERRPRREREGDARREPVTIPATSEPAEAAAPAGGGATEEGHESRGPARGRVFVSAGEVDGADEARIRETVAALVPGVDLQKVELRRTHVFLEVKPEDVDGLVAGLHGKEAFGKALAAEKARRRRR